MRKQQLIALLLGSLLLASAGCVKQESLPTEQDAKKSMNTTSNKWDWTRHSELSASKR